MLSELLGYGVERIMALRKRASSHSLFLSGR
jgi:hypothetical protein